MSGLYAKQITTQRLSRIKQWVIETIQMKLVTARAHEINIHMKTQKHPQKYDI